MLKKLLPKNLQFFDFLEETSKINITAAELLLEFTKSGKDIKTYALKLKELERDANKKVRHCVEVLHQSFITPIERTEIFELITRQDDILDNIYTAVSRIDLYDASEIHEELIPFAEVLKTCTDELSEAIHLIRDMKNFDRIRQIVKKVDDLETESDALLRTSLGKLFKEGDIQKIILRKEIFEKLEKAADKCETLSQIINGIVLEYS